MLTDDQTLIVYKGQSALVDMAYTIAEKRQYGENVKLKERYRAYRLMNLLEAIDDVRFLTPIELENILNCIKDISGEYQFGGIPLISNRRASILVGGRVGSSGQPGINGSNANINVLPEIGEDQIAVREEIVDTVKNYYLSFSAYIAPLASIAIQGSTTREVGVVIAVLSATVSTTKGSRDITTREITSPAGVSIDNTNMNGATQPNVVTVTKASVSTTTTFTLNVQDGTSTVTSSSTINFYYPWFYGALTSASTTVYGALTKVVAPSGNKTALFNDTNKYFYFAIPASWGQIVDIIKDGNGFDVTSGWQRLSDVSVTSTGLDVNWNVTYRVYRTNVQTSIPNQTYSFTLKAG